MLRIRLIDSSEVEKLRELINLYATVFELDNFKLPSTDYLQSLLDKKGLSFLVAEQNDKIVGGLTAHDLPSTYFEASEVYVYDLAVAKQHQRTGVGKLLLTELARICNANGAHEFFLQADVDDMDAIEFYRATGGVAEEVIHFSYDTK